MNPHHGSTALVSEGTNSSLAGPPDLQDLISLSQAATIGGLSPNHLRLLVRTGEVWGIKVGRNWLTTEMAVKHYLASDRKPGPKTKHGRE